MNQFKVELKKYNNKTTEYAGGFIFKDKCASHSNFLMYFQAHDLLFRLVQSKLYLNHPELIVAIRYLEKYLNVNDLPRYKAPSEKTFEYKLKSEITHKVYTYKLIIKHLENNQ